MRKIKWWAKNWPEAFVALDLWLLRYPVPAWRIFASKMIRRPVLIAVSRWDDIG
jgi:hypothetical protein